MNNYLRSPIRTNKGREATLCERVIRREATETEGLVLLKLDCCVCLFVYPGCKRARGIETRAVNRSSFLHSNQII